MEKIDIISKELFDKLRGRFSPLELGDENGEVTSSPEKSRFFNFNFVYNKKKHGNITINVTRDELVVIFSKPMLTSEKFVKEEWFNFLKELRMFSKKNMLGFDVRDINKNELTKRDFKYMSNEKPVRESKAFVAPYVKKSKQKIGGATLVVMHKEAVDSSNPRNLSKKISKIFIESPSGERFIYPMNYLTGARAMARHISEGGVPYDEFGSHIFSLAEEMKKLAKFKKYTKKSNIMAEGLREYVPIIEQRIAEVRAELTKLKTPSKYDIIKNSYAKTEISEVPEDVTENWIDQLTIRQFNEELKDIFPYVYNLVSKGIGAKEVSYEDIVSSETDGTQKITDFIMSYFDKDSRSFPKGETAVLTKIEKIYGDRFIEPSKLFIKRLKNI